MGRRAARAPILPGAERGVSIDRVPERPAMTEQYVRVGTIDCTTTDVAAEPRERTGGRGPDVCIEVVGAEARSHGPMHLYDRAEQRLRLQTDRPTAVRQAVHACR
ncbi:glutathione-dependent formaldehyde dehydrogenase, partial [Streptomyces hirsutus]